MSANEVRLRMFMRQLDALWGTGEVLAHDLQESEDAQECEKGAALADLLQSIQDSSLQSGLTSEDL